MLIVWQVGKFLLPRPGYPVDYKSDKEMYWHIGEKDVSALGSDAVISG